MSEQDEREKGRGEEHAEEGAKTRFRVRSASKDPVIIHKPRSRDKAPFRVSRGPAPARAGSGALPGRGRRMPGTRPVADIPEVRQEELPPLPPPAEIDLDYFKRIFSYLFTDLALLDRALTHRSVQPQGERSDYERLEFLGDAVLDLAVAHLLLEAHLGASEGELSKMRAALVNTTTLAEIAREIELGRFIRLSRGEIAAGGAERNSTLADVMEAVFGALYKEAGFEAALLSIKNLFGERIHTVLPRDPKTELQEALHALGKDAPVYLLECTEGPEHCPIFISVVQIEGKIYGRGRGPTKKVSQQEAAAQALAALREAIEEFGSKQEQITETE